MPKKKKEPFKAIFCDECGYGNNSDYVKYSGVCHGCGKVLDEKAYFKAQMNKKLRNDPRITKAGKLIRRYSIDELPQLINIFLGDMSLIGNRPYLPREKEDMGDSFSIIVSTKPGLTGWWACQKDKARTYKDRLKLEYYYIENKSIILDIKCIFKTIIFLIKNI